MDYQNNIQDILSKHPVIPVVSFEANDNPLEFAQYLLANNIHCIEVTLRTEEAISAVKAIKQSFGSSMAIGIGTVIHSKQIDELKELEVDFLVSPGTTEELVFALKASHIPFITGVSSPSDIMQAINMGLKTLKFFPANLFGGMAALKTYASVFKDVKFCPTGGISKQTYKDYLALDNVIAVGGSWMQQDFKENKI